MKQESECKTVNFLYKTINDMYFFVRCHVTVTVRLFKRSREQILGFKHAPTNYETPVEIEIIDNNKKAC